MWQPYASAVALLLKGIETRGWSTDYRGPLAIHAARRFGGAEKRFAQVERALGRLPARLPLGAVVCVVDLVDVRPTHELVLTISAIEKMYGNYEPGRFGWMFENVRVLQEPVPFIGRQRFFNVPDQIIEAALLTRAKKLGTA